MVSTLGLYIHIPFCCSKCDYCDFYSMPAGPDRMDAYQKALLAHIRDTADSARPLTVDTVYIGGGTPSYYGGLRLRELLYTLQRRFRISRTAEITVECNPDSVDKVMLTGLRRAGVNRISMGMQSADDTLLRGLHRPHDFAQVVQAVRAVREAKIRNLSLDLIYGLPGQDMEAWKRTLNAAIALNPEHLSCYGLKVEEGTPLAARDPAELPDDDAQADMYLWAVERLRQAGYAQYEVSNFARPGYESRHNMKYWLGREYAGFGPAAHSDFGGRRYSFVRDLDAYIRGVAGEGDLLDSSEVISREERAAEYLMLRLRTVRGIEEWEYRREFLQNFDPIAARLAEFEDRGWAVCENRRWHLTPAGFLVSNQLIGILLEEQERARKQD